MDTFSEQVPDGEKFSVGYFEKPGNSKRCIESAEDTKAMYKTYRFESTINILCDGQMEGAPEVSRAKRGSSGDSTACSKIVKREEEIDSILRDFMTDIVRTIATLSLQINGRRNDLDSPPNVQAITGQPQHKHKREQPLTEALTCCATAITNVLMKSQESCEPPCTPPSSTHLSPDRISPAGKAKLSGQYLQQLNVLQQL